jgi:hypothetical protein
VIVPIEYPTTVSDTMTGLRVLREWKMDN